MSPCPQHLPTNHVLQLGQWTWIIYWWISSVLLARHHTCNTCPPTMFFSWDSGPGSSTDEHHLSYLHVTMPVGPAVHVLQLDSESGPFTDGYQDSQKESKQSFGGLTSARSPGQLPNHCVTSDQTGDQQDEDISNQTTSC